MISPQIENIDLDMDLNETNILQEEEFVVMPQFDPEEMGIVFPNLCQSLHIGCNEYNLKDPAYASVNKSHSDAETYA
jgi:hypothetical protein